MEPSFAGLFQNIFGTLSAGLSDWGGLHPLVVHFPIVLFFVAPAFTIAALVRPASARVLNTCAVSLMLAGVVAIFAATSSGEMAAEHLTSPPLEVIDTLDAHYRLAEQARLGFCILTGIFLFYVFLYRPFTARFGRRGEIAAVSLFLLIYAFQLLLLFNAAHYGGRLVHKYGLRSSLYASPSPGMQAH
ncbi:MAG: hypothetical protein KC897_06535 [Candidatus Omnitrophica bacterium]|nr:hypothetical protein [Candidatus Omnitrophota bacterium]MCB9720286.1 hypothetical protein [Candidatus Omnitrophota bacterium]